MSDLYGLTDDQMARLQPYFPKSHGKPRVDDHRVLTLAPMPDRLALMYAQNSGVVARRRRRLLVKGWRRRTSRIGHSE